MSEHVPHLALTSKQVLILIQALLIAKDSGEIYEHASRAEVEQLRDKLNNVK